MYIEIFFTYTYTTHIKWITNICFLVILNNMELYQTIICRKTLLSSITWWLHLLLHIEWCGDKDVNEASGVWPMCPGRCVTWPMVTSPIVSSLPWGDPWPVPASIPTTMDYERGFKLDIVLDTCFCSLCPHAALVIWCALKQKHMSMCTD